MLHLHPGWPLAALLVLYPLWWAIGIGPFAFVLFAIPMAFELRRRRPIAIPPGFWLWLLYLAWNLISLVMLPLSPPGTTTGSIGGRSISIVVDLFELAAATVIFLYVGALRPDEVPTQRVVRWLCMLFTATVLGGLLGMVMPHFAFTSPIEAVLPHGIRTNAYAETFVHPNAAQVENVLGYTSPRPAAPWAYTNFWGNDLSILLVWFVIYQRQRAGARNRFWYVAGLFASLVTIVYSLNRGVWFGLVLCVIFVIAHLARRGDLRASLAVLMLVPVIGIGVAASPLQSVLAARASHGQSNSIRHFLDVAAWHGALDSPIIGWGATRRAIGSAQSIAIGPSAACPNCGNISIGSTGSLWQVMFYQGLVGLLFYFGFFVSLWWNIRGDPTPVGAAARLVLILAVFYSVFYVNLPSALVLTMISAALSWRTVSTQRVALPHQVATQP